MKGIWLFVMLLLVACGRDKVAQVSGRVDGEDSVVTFAFDNIGAALNYKERFSVVDAFEKNQYGRFVNGT